MIEELMRKQFVETFHERKKNKQKPDDLVLVGQYANILVGGS